MMQNNFDPYDILIQVSDRLARLEQAHNKMADAFHKTEVDLQVTLHSLRNLQQRHLQLTQKINELEAQKGTQ